MLTFAEKPKVTQQTTPARPALPDRTYPARSREASSLPAGSTRCGHDFGRMSIFPRQRTAWQRLPADEEIPSPVPRHRQIGVGQVDGGSAPEASPRAGEEPRATAEEGAGAEAPAEEAEPAPGAACAISSRTAVHAPDGTADTRTTIGVCETVGFSAGGQVVNWTANTGWPRVRNGQASFNWAAPERPGTSTITATDPGTAETCSLDMNVVKPAGLRMRNVNELAYPPGAAGAGMELTVHVHPRNVNFGWIAIREDSGTASRISGYFAARPAAALRHEATPSFRRMGWNNSLAPNEAGETQGDTAATVPGTLPSPWSAGAFQWIIPTRYRCSNSTGNGHVFTYVQQRFMIEDDGTVIVTKHTARVERTP